MTADDPLASGLSRIQQRGLVALMVSRTITDAAAAVSVSEKTMRRWLADETFVTAYRAAARESARTAVSALLSAQEEAVGVLRQHLRAVSPATAVRAARALLELGVRVGAEDLDERITGLEQEVARWEAERPNLRLA